MGKHKNTSRRDFIKLAGTTALVAGASRNILASEHTLESQQSQNVSPNDKIQIALIGAGGMGFGDTQTALRVPGTELVAAADVYDGRLTRVKEVWGNHIFTTRDYKEILARPDVDAVIIATPDHWHSQITIDAMKAGKDVYCEKPMVQTVEEGHPVIEAEKKTGRILQVGSQRVSNIAYHKAKELLASGSIGELNFVEAWINRRGPIPAWQYSIPPDASIETIDWERFLGRAPKRPFEPVRLFRWRNYRDYGTGIGGDLFVHLFSGIHLIAGSNGPSRVLTTGGLRYWKDGRDVPDVLLGLYDYPQAKNAPAFNIAMRVNFADGSVDPNQFESSGFRFVGSEGVMTIANDSVTIARTPGWKEPGFTIGTFPKAIQEAFIKEYRAKYPEEKAQVSQGVEEKWSAPNGYNDRLDHFRNFFEGVRTRKPVVEDSTFGFRAAGPALLSNISYFENRICEWDPEAIKLKKSNS